MDIKKLKQRKSEFDKNSSLNELDIWEKTQLLNAGANLY